MGREDSSKPRTMSMQEGSSGAPGTPGEPRVGSNGATATTIWLEWTKPKSGGPVENYELEIVNRPLTKTVKCNMNQVEVHDLQPSQIYGFRVRACNAAGESCWSGSTQQCTAYSHDKEGFGGMKQTKAKKPDINAGEKKGVCNACVLQ